MNPEFGKNVEDGGEVLPAHQNFIERRQAAIRDKSADSPELTRRLSDIFFGKQDEVINELNELHFGSNK